MLLGFVIGFLVLVWVALIVLPPSRRRSERIAFGGLVVGLAAVAGFAVLSVAFSGDDCAFPGSEWRGLKRESPHAETRARELAQTAVRCRLLTGLSTAEIRALLGEPDRTSSDRNPRPHREWAYLVGIDRRAQSGATEASLFMEFDHGRVVFAAAPEKEAGGDARDITNGTPVGGGPR